MKIILAITGASGAIYADLLLKTFVELELQIKEVSLVFSKNAKIICLDEIGEKIWEKYPFTTYENNDFFAPFASGSSDYDAMIICPCSMGILGRIANGISDDLITRSADVMLKERKKIIFVTRETPLNLIHINNMKIITETGGIICPAVPSFYSKANSITALCKTVSDRVIDLLGLKNQTFRWKT